jgi:hypothetical protein
VKRKKGTGVSYKLLGGSDRIASGVDVVALSQVAGFISLSIPTLL